MGDKTEPKRTTSDDDAKALSGSRTRATAAPRPISHLAGRGSTTGAKPRAEQEERQPDWNQWLNMPSVSIEEAVALSCDVEPSQIKRDPYGWMAGRTIYLESAEFARRISTLERNCEPGGPLAKSRNAAFDRLPLGQFVDWARTVGWSMPPHLLAALPKGDPPESDIASDPRLLKTFRRMILGMAMSKFDYVPGASRSDAPAKISKSLSMKGLAVGSDTVSRRLREAADDLRDELDAAQERRSRD